MSDHDEITKAIRKFHEDVIKGYLEKPNQKLDESIRNLTDKEFFLLSMIVLFDFVGEKVIFKANAEDGKTEPQKCPVCGSDNRPKIHGCFFVSEECKKNPCKDCGLKECEQE